MTRLAEVELARLNANPDLLRLARSEDVALALQKLRQEEDDLSRVALLGKWERSWPAATLQLLAVVSRDAEHSGALAPALVSWMYRLPPHDPVMVGIEEVLIRAWPTLKGPWREAATDLAGVRKAHGIREPAPRESVSDWPKGRPFPPASTALGAHARLTWCGFHCGAPCEVMTEALRGALLRYQLSSFLEPTGELDEETIEELEGETPAAP